MIINIEKTAKQTGIDDKETLKMLFGEFFNVCQADINKLPASISAGNCSEVRAYAHNIKGAAKNLWLEEIGNEAEVLENLGKSSSQAPMAEAYSKLLKVFNEGKDELVRLG